MKIKELEDRAVVELQQERETMAVETIKERIREINEARKTLSRMEKGYQALLEEDLDSFDA